MDLSIDEALNVRDVRHNQSNNATDNGNYVTWTKEMDTCLSKLLVEQMSLGNKIEKKACSVHSCSYIFEWEICIGLDKGKRWKQVKHVEEAVRDGEVAPL